MKKLLISIGTLLIAGLVQAQLTGTENYIQSRVYLEPVTTSSSAAKKIETVQYFDGLGRPKQIVNVKATPSGKDLVTTIPYDGFGRQVDSWLPAPMNTLNGAIQSGVDGAAQTFHNDPRAFTHQNLENSPLDRVLSQVQPGTPWEQHPVQFGYEANANGEVKKYIATFNYSTFSAELTVSTTGYAANQLYKNPVTDEDGNQTIEFKNGRGQVLLVRKVLSATANADTYYVYNDYNQLAYVIPPKAAIAADPNTVLNDLCYQYKYDGRDRLVEKKLPGKGWEYMVYDKANRLILSQDIILKGQGKWLITKYDQFGRIVYTGFLGTGGERAARQNEINNLVITESRNATGFTRNGMTVYYTDGYFAGEITTILSVNYYDTYPSYSFNPTFPTDIIGQPTLMDNASTDGVSTKSLPVMSLVKNIEDDNWTKNYIYYDKKGRTIGNYSINHLGGYTRTESLLDFAGMSQRTNTYHRRLAGDVEKFITEGFIYDSQNRLLQHYHKVDNNPEVVLGDYAYNELSQLRTKSVGSGLQSIEYQYNIRGWMTKINDPANLNGKLFGYNIKYNNPESSTITPGRFNGNIAEIDWKNSSEDVLKRYNYEYDALNRLKNAFYKEPTTGNSTYFDEYLTYDLNGNIATLKRTAPQVNSPTATLIDNLEYQYAGNRLTKVIENIPNSTGYEGGNNTIDYDLNGSMINMKDKGIGSITYNHLSLPDVYSISQTDPFLGTNISFGLNYLYRADGVKVRKTQSSGGGRGQSTTYNYTDYLDGFQYSFLETIQPCLWCRTSVAYEQEAFLDPIILDPPPPLGWILDFVPTAEGFYSFKENRYIYQYKDHLGNARVSFGKDADGNLEITDVNNYYAFGMNHIGGTKSLLGGYRNYKYNGKELQETGMYDYGARFYMPDIGRWGVVDPLAEKMTRHSPYNYAFNNPIRFIDPDGREGEDWFKNSFGDMEFRNDIQSQQDMTDKGVEGEYVGETAQVGNLTYAADGNVYDDSASGGGLPVENGKTTDIAEVTMTQKPSAARQAWNFASENIISKPVEGVQFFGYFFYGLGQVPGEMYKQGRMENIHVKMDMTLRGFRNGNWVKTMEYVDGETVMSEQEKMQKMAMPGVDVMTLGVGTKLNLVKNTAANIGLKIGIKAATKTAISKTMENE
ncbi:hypothetical protein ASG22_00805 [Chryseobacterium sp. Leaf405]|uniref:DUF6443 domain-containing protein n=1 Tax=Chryseobacterium sp. Leaf405 TaxID=1736367 RepID=UPI0006FD3D42|nr:DUF6443 domain-containing protein [Chryseobacterium sp. Leaf405]KQT35597.1 hypothetical protein ASG22_00805 [Chryseobacterium sp. Leaf405]